MALPLISNSHAQPSMPAAQRRGQLLRLLDVALQSFNGQFDNFISRLVDKLITQSELATDTKLAHLYFNASNLLNKNRYVFFHVASSRTEAVLRQSIALLDGDTTQKHADYEGDLSLVPFDEMDNKVVLGATARAFESTFTDTLNALNIRLAFLAGRDDALLAMNPFRPEIWLDALQISWSEFDPDTATHSLILPLLTPDVFFSLGELYDALNDALITAGVLPELGSAYRIRKSDGNLSAASNNQRDDLIRQKLRALFAQEMISAPSHADQGSSATASHQLISRGNFASTHADSALLAYVSQLTAQPPATGGPPMRLTELKQHVPAGSMRRIDETTIDLLSHVFDSVFSHQLIPNEVKNLIGILQVPVLKTALQDKEFFYSDDHPARKLINLLSRTGLELSASSGVDDPLYQTIKRSVERVQTPQSADDKNAGFAQAVQDLEVYLLEAESAATIALEAPITAAMRSETIHFATRAAKSDIAERISVGDVAPFIETFLENRWLAVLTLAHSLKEDKPEILNSAIKTMDDLLWSVKPKATATERRELITRLPTILGMLNKWLDVTKWADAERLQFFADLAEAHASIVRAPLDLTPERQLEIAVDAAKKAAERRIELQTKMSSDPAPDECMAAVTQLQRGAWIEVLNSDAINDRESTPNL